MDSELAKYECRILPLGLFKTISFAVSVSMGLMFALIFVGIPFWLTGILFFGIMYGCMYLLFNEATFVLSENYLERLQPRKPPYFTSLLEQKYRWEEVASFKKGTDSGRYRGEYQYLEIFFKDGTKWSLTDSYGEKKIGFNDFMTQFNTKVNQINDADSTIDEKPFTKVEETKWESNPPKIKQKKTFYDTIWAKLFTALMIVFVIGILLFYIVNPRYLNFSSGVKVLVVLIPGVIYLAKRVFFSNKNNTTKNEL
jgi:hypothetical protein